MSVGLVQQVVRSESHVTARALLSGTSAQPGRQIGSNGPYAANHIICTHLATTVLCEPDHGRTSRTLVGGMLLGAPNTNTSSATPRTLTSGCAGCCRCLFCGVCVFWTDFCAAGPEFAVPATLAAPDDPSLLAASARCETPADGPAAGVATGAAGAVAWAAKGENAESMRGCEGA